MSNTSIINLTRRQIYDEIWEISVAGMARKYGIPYTQLMKQIKEAQILKYEEELKLHSWASKPQIRKYDYIYNGKLSLNVDGQKSFRDRKSYIVEECLGEIMIEMYKAASAAKKARIDREEAERKRREEELRKEERRKRYDIEVDRTLELTNLAEDYDTACKLRHYIAVVETSGTLYPETKEWIEWAKAKADWYDPTIAKKDDFFGKREHAKSADKKKLQYMDYWRFY